MMRAVYSAYYGDCVGKRVVSNQLCGWIHVEEVLTGRISDSKAIIELKILNQQEKFSEMDKSTKGEKFTNVFECHHTVAHRGKAEIHKNK